MVDDEIELGDDMMIVVVFIKTVFRRLRRLPSKFRNLWSMFLGLKHRMYKITDTTITHVQ
jgi:hypothetical protein